jgi:hypothetical protein
MKTLEAKAAWAKNRRRQIAYGRWQPTEQLDPTPVREHIANLRTFGMSVQTIAHLAGEKRGALSQIVYPNHSDYLKWITPERANRLLAVRFDLDAIPSGRNVDAAGTRRRIEALMRMGWSQGHIARALGVSRQRVSKYRQGAHVESDTARAVRDLFRQWWDKPGPEVRAVNKAIREGFAPPLAWDDIDDPSATPDIGTQTLTPSQRHAENAADLLAHDPLATLPKLAERLGLSANGLHVALVRAGADDLRERLNRNAELEGHTVRRSA